MTYTIVLNYFNIKGEQLQKELSRKTVKGLVSAVSRFNDTHEIYHVNSISQNLANDKAFNDYIGTLGWR